MRTIESRARPDRESLSKPFNKELDVLKLIHANRSISRMELAKKTSLSAASITAIVRDLIDRALVMESGHNSSAVGRRPVSLSIRDTAGFLVGVDLGSFYTRVVVTDIQGTVVFKQESQSGIPDGRDVVLSRTLKAIHKAIDDSRIPAAAIKGIGMGHSGVIDASKGLVLSFPRPGQMAEWKNIPLKQILEHEFGIPCLLEDSVRAIATAEKYFGLGTGLNDFIYIDVGMGVGAAIHFDGKLYRGPGGSAGEFGHMTVNEHGPLCCCGNYGCLETLASCGAIIQSVKSAIEKGVDSRVRELAQGNLNQISIEMIGQAAMQNDSLSFRVLHEAVSHIGVALADVVNLLNPHVLVFGGALFRSAPELFLEPLRRTIKQRALEKSANEVTLKISNLGSEAGALGAGRLISEIVVERLYRDSLGC
jgi:predicted NBD/HSP70 family sugar kinase